MNLVVTRKHRPEIGIFKTTSIFNLQVLSAKRTVFLDL